MKGMISGDGTTVEIGRLLNQFYKEPLGFVQLAEFCRVISLPSPYDALLDHNAHMTMTMETRHGEPVDVKVHRTLCNENWYSREITLHTRHTGKAVLYAITLLKIDALEPDTWGDIESERTPLGRVLIEHDIVREVQRCDLWQLRAGPGIASLLSVSIGTMLFGRTASIRCNGKRAIELLEILAPV